VDPSTCYSCNTGAGVAVQLTPEFNNDVVCYLQHRHRTRLRARVRLVMVSDADEDVDDPSLPAMFEEIVEIDHNGIIDTPIGVLRAVVK